MIRLPWIYVLILIIATISCQKHNKNINLCLQECPINFSKHQKATLCMNNPDNPIPGICARATRSSLPYLKADEIVSICADASSLHGIKCLESLSSYDMRKYGKLLCDRFFHRHNDTSALILNGYPSQCYNHLIKTSSLYIDKNAAVIYCSPIRLVSSTVSCIDEMQHIASNMVKKTELLNICKNIHIFANITTQCIRDMSQRFNIFQHDRIADVVTLCLSTSTYHQDIPSSAILCCDQAEAISSSHILKHYNLKMRLELCHDALVVSDSQRSHGIGAVLCADALLQQSKEAIDSKTMVSLCQGAADDGPARCYVHSKGIGSVDLRISICRGARDEASSSCYRQAIKISTINETLATSLCSHATSSDPASCLSSAPVYLSASEAMILCGKKNLNLSVDDPIGCMKSAQLSSKLFHDAPKRSLDYNYDTTIISSSSSSSSDHKLATSRHLMLTLCSSKTSTSSYCYDQLARHYRSLSHDHALSICINRQSYNDDDDDDDVEYMMICIKMMLEPHRHHHRWPIDQVARICSYAKNQHHAMVIDACVYDVYMNHQSTIRSILTSSYNHNHTVEEIVMMMCQHETSTQSSSQCIYDAFIPPLLDMSIASLHSIIYTCNHPNHTQQSGTCLNKLLFSSSYRPLRQALMHLLYDHTYDSHDMILYHSICISSYPMTKLKCLDHMKRVVIYADDISYCHQYLPTPNTVYVRGVMMNDDNDMHDNHHIIAGRRFQLRLQVLDQYNDPYMSSSSFMVSVSINAKVQLWGIRSNYSYSSIITYDHLTLSRAGSVEIIISSIDDHHNMKIIGMILVHVVDDMIEDDDDYDQCIDLLSYIQCDASESEYDRSFLYPRIRSILPITSFPVAMICIDYLQSWHINIHITSSYSSSYSSSCHHQLDDDHHISSSTGISIIIEYRHGIDAIWLHNEDLPQDHMTYEERFGLQHSSSYHICRDHRYDDDICSRTMRKQMVKEIRHEYYKKSLLWHPDRWIGYDRYQVVVRGAFQLIAQSYDILLQTINSNHHNDT